MLYEREGGSGLGLLMVPWAKPCACVYPSHSSAVWTLLENSRSVQRFVSCWKIPQKSHKNWNRSVLRIPHEWPTLCLETNLTDVHIWEEEKEWGMFTEPLVLSFLGVGPCAGSGFKDNLILPHLVTKTSPTCQLRVPAQWKQVDFFTQAARLSYPPGVGLSISRTKELEEDVDAAHHSANITQSCLTPWLSGAQHKKFCLYWPWNAYSHVFRHRGP